MTIMALAYHKSFMVLKNYKTALIMAQKYFLKGVSVFTIGVEK